MASRDSAQTGQGQNRVYLRRNRSGGLAFVPWGLIPLLGFVAICVFAVFPFSQGVIQRSAQISAERAATELGADWARISTSGQWVTLEGAAPSSSAAETLAQAIGDTRRRTILLFSARPVSRIFNNTMLAGTAPPATGQNEFADRMHDWSYTIDGNVLRLSGQMPEERTLNAVLDTANDRLDPPRLRAVHSELVVTDAPAPNGFQATALRGINTLTLCDGGTASFAAGLFSLNCQAPGDRLERIRRLAERPLLVGRHGRIDISATEVSAGSPSASTTATPQNAATVEACNQAMLALLSDTKIAFASASARIARSSDALLNDVADAAMQCPGMLRIAGHSDTSGLEENNEILSQQRAEAVRGALIARGIMPSRLLAEGFGARQPISDNETLAGRARNRRIEISVIRGAN